MALVSVIICTRNRASDLRDTLDTIVTQRPSRVQSVELLIVDNGSTDETAQVVADASKRSPFPVRYVLEETPGVAFARNTALYQARGDVLLYTDDDVRVRPGWIDDMTRPILDDGFDAVAGGVKLAPHLERPWMDTWHRAYLASTEGLSRPIDNLVGANMALSRRVLEEVPAFDTEIGPGRLGLSEESHFGERLHQAGFRIADALHVEVEHHCSPERLKRSSYIKAATKLGRSMAYLHHHWRHREQPFGDEALRTYLSIFILRAKLWVKRVLNPSYLAREEGFANWENYYVREIAYLKQSLIERRRPRQYPKLGSQRLSTDRTSPSVLESKTTH